jgi:iron complex outermembrane receptor protein
VRRILIATCALLSVVSTRAQANALAVADCNVSPVRAVQPWPEPLNRLISVRGGGLSLRDALDRVSAAARVRITYSDALIAPERRVCFDFTRTALGDAITQLIGDEGVAPRVASRELVVLAPSVPQARAEPSVRAAPLERVVVTGTATGGAQRGLGVSLGVVDGNTLEAQSRGDMSEFLNGVVPGVWLWQQSPTSLLARYGSIRGASSFGVSYPKVYVDGVEVANPLVVSQLPAESIERLEVLRGPQGAALYGTDAISGVLQVVTRQPTQRTDVAALRVRAQSGFVNSAYASSGTFGQELTISGHGGSVARAGSGALSVSRLGAFVPAAESQQITASGRARAIGSRSLAEVTARLVLADVASSSNPILVEAVGDAFTIPDSVRRPGLSRFERSYRDSLARRLQLVRTARQSLQQFTGGVSGTFYPNARWTHRALLGLDTYALNGSTGGVIPLPSASDSALRAAEGSATRTSMRVSSAAVWSDSSWQRTLTFAGEHAVLYEATSNGVLARPGPITQSTGATAVWRQTSGLVSQLDLAWQNQLFVTAGARVERSAGFVAEPLVSLLPMVGASFVRDLGDNTFKVRAAYGKGIRPPRVTVSGATLARDRLLPNDALEPESQAGTEFGADLFFGKHTALHVTRFDQRASGLVQPVTVIAPIAPSTPPRTNDPLNRNLAYQLQNVGAISNSGWELEGRVRAGAFVVQSSFTHVASRVLAIRRGYTGELRVGDRMLDVPAQTFGLSLRWDDGPWNASLGATRVADWIGYDRIAAAQTFVTPGRPATALAGPALRQLWIPYDGVTRVHASLMRDLPGALTLILSGENLLNHQTGEPDNITILPGRSIAIGLRARF